MKLDDLLSLAGNHPLETFDWGPRVVEVINYWVGVGFKVNASMTGAQTRQVIRSLPPAQLIHLFSIDLDTQTGKVTDERDDDEPHSPVPTPVVVPPAEPPRRSPTYERYEERDEPEVESRRRYLPRRRTDGPRNTKLAFALTFGSVIALIAITLTIVTVKASMNGTTPPESSTLVKVVQALADVTGMFADTGGRRNGGRDYDPYEPYQPYPAPYEPDPQHSDPPTPPPPEPPVQ